MPMNRTPPSSPSIRGENSNASSHNVTNGNTMEQNETNASAGNEIHRVSIKAVPFMKNTPELYFLQMDAQFKLAGITRDETKYNYILGTLDPTYLNSVLHIMRNPPVENKYETIKNTIIMEYQQSDQAKLRTLLRETELSDLKPSQLLRKMRDLSNNALSDEAIKALWVERLPEQIRPVISISDNNLTKQASMADKMLEISSYNIVNEVTKAAPPAQTVNDPNSTFISEIFSQLDELRKDVAAMAVGRNRETARNFSRESRPRSASRSKKGPYCYYHYKFGAMAQKAANHANSRQTKTPPLQTKKTN